MEEKRLASIEKYKFRVKIFYALSIYSIKRLKLKFIAKIFAMICLYFLKKIPLERLEDCATNNISIFGILIPGLLHEGVVQYNMKTYYGIDLY